MKAEHEPADPCHDVSEALSVLIDGELDPIELLPVIDHLAECPKCRAFYQQSRAFDDRWSETFGEPAAGGQAPRDEAAP